MSVEITIEDAFRLENPLFVDLRSPAEYQEATIPGAVNLPLFHDDERAEIGTIYRQEDPRRARERGLEIVAPRLFRMVKNIESYTREHEVVLFCWRGGERSQAVATVLQLMDVGCYRLSGGYRAYRRYVTERLKELPSGEVVVLHGLTGCGKTELIKRLRKLGYAAVDLEGLASHRGSVFGGVGMGPQPSQKMFDSLLLREMWELSDFPYLVVEGESRRIGRLFLPDHLWDKMGEGRRILVYDRLENRVGRLMADYATGGDDNIRELVGSLKALEKYIGAARVKEFTSLVEKRVFSEVVEYLLVNYYDRLYRYPAGPDVQYEFCVSTADMDRAVLEVTGYLEEQYGTKG